MILEWDADEIVKRSFNMADRDLSHLVRDPVALHSHILKGIAFDRGLIAANPEYWAQMASYWTNLLPEQHQRILHSVMDDATRRFRQYQITGQLTEGVMDAITDAAAWIGKQASKFGSFLAKLAAILMNVQGSGYGGGMGGPGGDKRTYLMINAKTVTEYCDKATVMSEQNVKDGVTGAPEEIAPIAPEDDDDETASLAVDPKESIMSQFYYVWKEQYVVARKSGSTPFEANEKGWHAVHRTAMQMKIKDWNEKEWKEFADYLAMRRQRDKVEAKPTDA
jgi:uncharacterized protein YbdZ (MbtH family)